MSLVSMQFFTFIVVALIGYYLIPKSVSDFMSCHQIAHIS